MWNKVKEKLIIHTNLIGIIFSFISLYGINAMIKKAEGVYIFSNSIFSIICFVAIYIMFVKTIEKKEIVNDTRRLIVCNIIGGGMSFSLVIGSNLLEIGYSKINVLSTWVGIVAGAIFISICINWLFINLPILFKKSSKIDVSSIPVPVTVKRQHSYYRTN